MVVLEGQIATDYKIYVAMYVLPEIMAHRQPGHNQSTKTLNQSYSNNPYSQICFLTPT